MINKTQRERKAFKVCLTSIAPEDKYKKVKNFFWKIDEYKWRMEHDV